MQGGRRTQHRFANKQDCQLRDVVDGCRGLRRGDQELSLSPKQLQLIRLGVTLQRSSYSIRRLMNPYVWAECQFGVKSGSDLSISGPFRFTPKADFVDGVVPAGLSSRRRLP